MPILKFRKLVPRKVVYRQVDFMSYDNGDNIDNQPSMSYEQAYCGKCGVELYHQDYKFCPHCGHPIDWGKKNENTRRTD